MMSVFKDRKTIMGISAKPCFEEYMILTRVMRYHLEEPLQLRHVSR